MNTYNKAPLTYTEQIELLKSRGLIFSDERRAQRHLANISLLPPQRLYATIQTK